MLKSILKRLLRQRRRLVIIGLSAVALIMVALIVRSLTAPVHGRPTSGLLPIHKTVKKEAMPPPAGQLESTYFSLRYPIGYQALPPNQSPPAGLLDYRQLRKPSSGGTLIVNIAIKALPAGGLAEESSYVSRQKQPGVYRLTDVSINGQAVHLASRADSGEVVAFWPHGGYLATIGLTMGFSSTSPDTGANQQLLITVLNGWQWQ